MLRIATLQTYCVIFTLIYTHLQIINNNTDCY